MLQSTIFRNLLPLIFTTLFLTSCGGGSSKSDEDANVIIQPSEEIVILEEEKFVSTLLFPGHKSLYLGSSIDIIGTVKPEYIERVSSIKVKAGELTFNTSMDAQGIWRVPSVPLKKQLYNDINVQLALSDGAEYNDEYTIIRSLPLQDISNPLISTDGSKAIFSNSSAESIFSIDLDTGLVDIVVDEYLGSIISWGPEENVIYGLGEGLAALSLETSEKTVLSPLELIPDEGFTRATGLNLDLDFDAINNELFVLIGAGTDGEKIRLSLPQAQIIFNIDSETEELIEFSGAAIGSGHRFYNGFEMDIDKDNRKIYVAENSVDKGLYQVDMITGDRVKVLDSHYPIRAIAVDEGRDSVYLNYFDSGIKKFESKNLSETLIFKSQEFPKVIRHLEVNTKKDELLVLSTAYESLHAGDLTSAKVRSIIPPLRDPNSFVNPNITGFTIDRERGVTYFINEYGNYIGVISSDSKRAKKVSGIEHHRHSNVGSGPSLKVATDIYLKKSGSELYVGNEFGQILEVDVTTGNRTLIEPQIGIGAIINSVTSMAVDEDNQLIYIADNVSDKIVTINILNNTQTLLVNYKQSAEEYDFFDVLDIAIDPENKTLWVSQREFSNGYFKFPLIELDLERYHRRPAYEVEHGSDLNFIVSSIAIDFETNNLYLGSYSKVYEFDPEHRELKEYAESAVGDARVTYRKKHLEIHSAPGIIYVNGGGIYGIDMASKRSARFY